MDLQNDLANYSFLTLLISMIFYWIATAFSPTFKFKSFEELPRGQGTDIISVEKELVKAPLAYSLGQAEVNLEEVGCPNSFGVSLDPLACGPQGKGCSEANLSLHQPRRGGARDPNPQFLSWPLLGANQLQVKKDKSKSFNFFSNFFNLAKLAKITIIISNILLGILLLIRWKDSGHFPLSNLYESLMFLSWCFTGIHIFIENYSFFYFFPPKQFLTGNEIAPIGERTKTEEFLAKNSSVKPLTPLALVPSEQGSNIKNNGVQDSFLENFQSSQLLGAITTPSALLTNAFATFTLPSGMHEILPLVPALKSNWLIMHVTVMILSYAALIIGSLLSIAFLIITAGEDNWAAVSKPFGVSLDPLACGPQGKGCSETNFSLHKARATAISASQNFSYFKEIRSKNLAVVLDNLSYRILGIAFPLLTIGILSGAVWANEAWGSYWSWDPKETWALLTWFVFAIYLHTRLSKGWKGKKPAIIASIGFVVVLICYLGVNLIGEGLHSYGWLS
jgi:cytochrome c-type biogenesis protein CcsB